MAKEILDEVTIEQLKNDPVLFAKTFFDMTEPQLQLLNAIHKKMEDKARDTIKPGCIPTAHTFFVPRGLYGRSYSQMIIEDIKANPRKYVGDGKPLFSGKHTQPALWKRIVGWFKRPRLSEDNLE